MKNSTLLLLAAAAVAYFVIGKHNASAQPATPGLAPELQPPGVPAAKVSETSGPTGSRPTLVQQLGGAPGIADGVVKLGGAIWDRIAGGDDSDPEYTPPDDTPPDYLQNAMTFY